MTTLAEIRAASNPSTFPVERLAGMTTAAAFYCAAFLGRQDVVHLNDAELEVIGVDIDAEKLAQMELLYDDFLGSEGDAVDFARTRAAREITYDVVVCDPWTHDIPYVLSRLDVFAAVCSRVLIVGLVSGTSAPNSVGSFHLAEILHRSNHAGGVWWAVFVRDEAADGAPACAAEAVVV